MTEFALPPGAVAHNRLQVEPAPGGGGRLAFLESFNKRGDLWVTEEAAGWPRQVTTEPHPPSAGSYGGGFFAWAGEDLVMVATDHQLWSLDARGRRARPLTELPGRCSAPAPSPDGTRVAFVYATSERTDVVVGEVGEKPFGEDGLTVLNRSDFAFDPDWSPDGSWLAWHEWDVPAMPWEEGRIVIGRPDGSARSVVDGEGCAVAQPRFSPDGRWLAYLSERTGWLNLWIADTSTWTPRHLVDEQAEHGSPPWRPRVRTFAWAPVGDRIAFVRNERGRDELWVVLLDGGDVFRLGGLQGSLRDLVWGERPVLSAASSTVPRALVALEADGAASVIADDGLAVWEEIEPLAAEPVVFPGEDGAVLHGLLWPSEGRGGLLLYCHGGPNGQVKDDWMPSFRYWVDRGWSVLAFNYRGSTGYGREYRDALQGRWGELDVSDGAAAARWAVEQDLARPGEVVAWGGSAGGYLVLMLLAHHGDLFAGGVNLFGVTDLEHLARHTHRFEAHYLDRLVGPLPAAAEAYRARSPLHLVDRIDRPLLTLQGEDDEAVPAQQSLEMHEALQGRGVRSELALYPGEGHGFSRVETLLDYLSRMEAFLDGL